MSWISLPYLFSAVTVIMYSPMLGAVPVIIPVCASKCKLLGRFLAVILRGRSPEIGKLKRKGFPGRAPCMYGAFIRGVFGSGGVSIYSASLGRFIVYGVSP